MIKVKEIQRVMVKVEDLDAAVSFCEKVLGAKFFLKTPNDPESPAGSRCALSTDPGLELIQITHEKGDLSMFTPEPYGPNMFEFIRDHAPGIIGVVFDMEGVEEAKQVAADMGIEAPFKFDFTQEELDMLGWDYTKYLEYFLDPYKTGNAVILLSEFKHK